MKRKSKRYISIFTRSVIAFLGLGFLPFVIISPTVFRKNIDKVVETAIHNISQIAKGTSDDIAMLLKEISDHSKYLYEYEADDYGYFYEIMTNDAISNVLGGNLVEDALKKMLYRNDSINHMCFIDTKGRVYSSTKVPEKIINQKLMGGWGNAHYVPEKSAVAIIPTHGTEYYFNSSEESFTYVRNIMSTRSVESANREILGTLYIDVSADSFQTIIDGAGLVGNDHIFVYGWGRDALIHNNYNGTEAAEDYGGMKKDFSPEDRKFCLKSDQTYYIDYSMKQTDWAMVEKLPFSSLEKTYQSTIQNTIYLVLVNIAPLMILYYFSLKTTAKPIRLLKDAMDKVKAGRLETRVNIRSNDELGVLAEGLNNMTKQLQKHIGKVYISEIRQKKAQIKALAIQIQSHYLYNTLDAIRMSAITNDDRDATLMLESLSTQMRCLIGDARSLMTLKGKLDSIRNYFIIIQIRYEGAAQLEISGKNETLEYGIPRLTLQPIIENSIKYGTSPGGEGNIAVYTEKKWGYLEITVLDDGVGMDGETLAYMDGVLKGTVIQERAEKRRFNIGLRNIEDRIKLQFGDCYGIRFNSTPRLGILVHAKLPIYYGEGEGDQVFPVVIADDGPLIIKGLMKMVDWEKLNAQVIGTSRNGEQLIRQIDEVSPDTIVSGISMPHQSGIDVIECINEGELKFKAILLSAFQELEYARQALRYGVIEYLLKPATKEELGLSIIEVERALKDNLSLEYLQEDAKSAQAVFKAVTSEYEYQSLCEGFEQMGMSTSGASYTGAYFSTVENRSRAKKKRSEFKLLRFTVFKEVEGHVVKRRNGFCLKREADFRNIMFFYGKNQEETILTNVKALIRTMEREYGVHLIAGIGKQTNSLPDLKFACKTTAFAYSLHYFKRDSMIIYDRINKEHRHSFGDYNEAYSALVKAILLRDDMWLDQLKQYLGLIGEPHYGNRVTAESRCVALLMELPRELGNYCRLDEEDRHTHEGLVSGIRNVGTFQKVKAMILRYLEQFMEKTAFPNLGNKNETIKGIKSYIRENYDQEVNLRSLSQHFLMNQYYFSSFFKQKIGKNSKDYLIGVRMQKALELLLENSGMNTQELARRVGYNDAKSFSERFRQCYGESPINYKKINKMWGKGYF